MGVCNMAVRHQARVLYSVGTVRLGRRLRRMLRHWGIRGEAAELRRSIGSVCRRDTGGLPLMLAFFHLRPEAVVIGRKIARSAECVWHRLPLSGRGGYIGLQRFKRIQKPCYDDLVHIRDSEHRTPSTPAPSYRTRVLNVDDSSHELFGEMAECRP